jgi:hypothetical protein
MKCSLQCILWNKARPLDYVWILSGFLAAWLLSTQDVHRGGAFSAFSERVPLVRTTSMSTNCCVRFVDDFKEIEAAIFGEVLDSLYPTSMTGLLQFQNSRCIPPA